MKNTYTAPAPIVAHNHLMASILEKSIGIDNTKEVDSGFARTQSETWTDIWDNDEEGYADK